MRLVAAALLSFALLAAPASAQTRPTEDYRTCVEGAYLAWNQTSVPDTVVFANQAVDCGRVYAKQMLSTSRARTYHACMGDAIAYLATHGPGGFPTFYMGTANCSESYLGYDIAIGLPDLV